MVPVRRRSVLGLLGATALAGCSTLGSSPSCSFDSGGAVDGWPLPNRDPQNTHAVPGEDAPALDDATVAWSVDLDRDVMPGVVSGDMLVVPGRRIDTQDPSDEDPPPAVAALDPATGDERWRTDIVYEADPGLGALTRSVAIGTEHVFLVQETLPSDTPNRLLALDRETGERAWAYEGIRQDGLGLGAGVVFARTDRAVTVLDPKSGEACGTIRVQGPLDRLLEPRTLTVQPAVAGGNLFTCSVGPRETPNEPGHYWLSGVDLASGEVRWTTGRFTVVEDVPDAVLADSDRVYLPEGNRIHAVDHEGNRRWDTEVAPANPDREGWPYTWKLALGGSHIVVELATYEAPNHYVCVDANSGGIEWRRESMWRHPVIAGDVVFGQRMVDAGDDGLATELHAMDLSSGETRATYRFGGILEYPPLLADGRLFAVLDAPIGTDAALQLLALS